MSSPIEQCPYYKLVPKGLDHNLRFRKALIEAARGEDDFRDDLWRMCTRDPLFYINAFGWTYDSRDIEMPDKPFVTYPFQDETLLDILDAMGLRRGRDQHDLLIEKSRDMGASWMVCYAFHWGWKFWRRLSFLMVSRNERLVDNSDDPDSLFWKLRYIEKMLPGWLRSPADSVKLRLTNVEKGSSIDGEPTTGDVGRGGRRTAACMDEFAAFEAQRPGSGRAAMSATADNTNCRILNSTPKGTGNEFYRRSRSNIKKIRLHWSLHPLKRPGLYTSHQGQLEILDKSCQFPRDYDFILDGKVRSLWYDSEERRRGSRQEMAQEVDIDYLQSGSQFYDEDALQAVEQHDVRDPMAEGDYLLEYLTPIMEGPLRVERSGREGFRFRVWVPIDPRTGPPHEADYKMGADISAGSDASNSVLSIGDARTGRKVAEFATINVLPEDFAKYAVALGRWFGGKRPAELGGGWHEPILLFENVGPGGIFGRRLRDLAYGGLYYGRRDDSNPRSSRSQRPGWHPSPQTIDELHAEYRRALAGRRFNNPSDVAVDLCRFYVHGPDGHVRFAGAGEEETTSGAKSNHGDDVVADALLWKLMKPSVESAPAQRQPKIPVGSFAWRRQRRKERARTVDSAWAP